MDKLRQIIREIAKQHNLKPDCGCGCSGKCGGEKAPVINENLIRKPLLSEHLQYHVDNKKPLTENTFRYGSSAFLDLWKEARKLYSRNLLEVAGLDKDIIVETDLGEFSIYEGQEVPLDLPMIEEGQVNEAEYQGKDVQLNKPKRGGSKKFYVYVMNPKTKKVKKVQFGAAGGGGNLAVKIRDPKARRAFAKRQNCDKKKDRTTPGYWSCNLPRYANVLGLKGSFSGYW
jgi:hypothetical protein